jgi:hypothetical protein
MLSIMKADAFLGLCKAVAKSVAPNLTTAESEVVILKHWPNWLEITAALTKANRARLRGAALIEASRRQTNSDKAPTKTEAGRGKND